MKNFSLYIVLLSTLILTSCGTSASYTSSAPFEDGIYYTPDKASIEAAVSAEQKQIAALTEETKAKTVCTEAVDTIVLGETSKDITLPLELDKSYVVLLEGETYEERFKKFEDEEDYTFSITFEMGYGAGYGYYYPWYTHAYYRPAHYYYGWYNPWYEPWYDPWYSPWYYPSYYPYYGPSYYYGWYDPWYYPGFYPGYYPMYPHTYPIGGITSNDVIHGRRDLSRNSNTSVAQISGGNRHNRTTTAAPATSVNQIRGRELNRGGAPSVKGDNTGTVTGNNGTIPTRNGVRNNYRASSSQNTRKEQTASGRDNGRATYQYNNNATQSTGASINYNQSRSNYQSGYSGGGSRSTGSSSGSSYRTGGRR